MYIRFGGIRNTNTGSKSTYMPQLSKTAYVFFSFAKSKDGGQSSWGLCHFKRFPMHVVMYCLGTEDRDKSKTVISC